LTIGDPIPRRSDEKIEQRAPDGILKNAAGRDRLILSQTLGV
jgi:hypothetical protein